MHNYYSDSSAFMYEPDSYRVWYNSIELNFDFKLT
jgi:hypothetical protein